MKFNSLIFDIDGVLIDVSQSYRQAIQKTVEEYSGYLPSSEEIQKYKERGGLNNDWDLTEAILLDKGKRILKQKIINSFQNYYLGKKWDGFISKEKLLLPKQTLLSLSKKYKLGILTGRPRLEAEFILKHYGLFELFEVIIAMEDTKDKPKPNPFGLNLNLEKLGKPSAYFGDSIDDMKAAVAAGIIGIGVIPPTVKNNTLKEKLYSNGAKVVIDTILDAEKVVLQLEEEKPSTVKEILSKVKSEGDKAVLEYNLSFDKNNSEKFELTKQQIKDAYSKVDKETIAALKYVANNIKTFAKAQMNQNKDFKMKTSFGFLEQKVIPLQKVGCYVPGGNYPLPSTALMTVVPAKVAGVKEVIVVSPNIKPVVIVAASIAGADRIFNIGGVQAIGALAFGTKQVPRVDKIVGPGNKYVAEAKKEVYGEVGIDFVAGPSEVLIVADESGNAELIAADMLAQAEHDINAKANLITTSSTLVQNVQAELAKQLGDLKTKEIAQQAIKSTKIIQVKNLEEAAKISNEMAPEHLELQLKNTSKYLDKFYNYGSLFVGENSAEALGDYCLGPNHTLPTSKSARYTGGLSVRDFVKIVTIQTVTKKDKKLINVAAKLAEVEGLMAHKKAAEKRL